jgi:hypothetical protein
LHDLLISGFVASRDLLGLCRYLVVSQAALPADLGNYLQNGIKSS